MAAMASHANREFDNASISFGAATSMRWANGAVSVNGIELQDREFFAAIREDREPNASVAQVLPCYQVLHGLELQLSAG